MLAEKSFTNTRTYAGEKMIPHPLKATALLYLRDALSEERYEEMADITAIAREFGADEWDIRIALSRNV